MSYPFNYPTPQNANVQIFNAASGPNTNTAAAEWVKPQGVSFVWFTLIGGGGGGGGTDGTNVGGGGGSGSILHCLAPAFILPDILRVQVGQGGAGGVGATAGSNGNNTAVTYNNKATYAFMVASAGTGGSPGVGGVQGSASAPTTLAPAVIYVQGAGQSGSITNTTASTTTPLSGGSAGTVTANYGYTTTKAGTFQISPILVGTGGGSDTSGAYNGGVGCGGGGISNLAQTTTTAGAGGAGMVVIISW
jgi:hypothetical protein